MNITQTTTRFYTETMQNQNAENAAGTVEKTRFFAGGIGIQNPLDTQIEEKRATTMEKAKKLLGDVFAAEKTIGQTVSRNRSRAL